MRCSAYHVGLSLFSLALPIFFPQGQENVVWRVVDAYLALLCLVFGWREHVGLDLAGGDGSLGP